MNLYDLFRNARVATRVWICTILSVISFCVLVAFVLVNADIPDLFRFGPSDDLYILSTNINTWNKYIGFCAALFIFRVVEVLSNDISGPAIGFRVYNDTTNKVYGFSPQSLAAAANIKFVIMGLSNTLRTLVIVSRFDIAIYSVIMGEITTAVVCRYLLSKKKFAPDYDTKDEADAAGFVFDDEESTAGFISDDIHNRISSEFA